MIGRFLIAMLAITLLPLPGLTRTVVAQGATPVPPPVAVFDVRTETTIDFPRGIGFRADLGAIADRGADRIEFRYTIAGNPTEHLVFVTMSGQTTRRRGLVELVVDLQSEFVPSGVTLEYQWEIWAGSTTIGETTPERVTWHDTRWPWETISAEQVRLHSYGLTPAFAASIIASAQATVTDLERRYALVRSQPIDIWVYPNAEDFRGAQQQNSREAVAGASYAGFSLIVAVIPEGDTREVGRVIPHEISHQVLYQATRNPFSLPPLWFDEGLATHYQIGGTDGYPRMVAEALQEGRLFQLDSLDTAFPFTPAEATLAYAVGWSAVEFIQQHYGDGGIERLIAAFAIGDSFDAAIQGALGVSLVELDNQWRAWIQQQAYFRGEAVMGRASDLQLAA